MNITEIRIRLVGGQKDRLKAFCCVTLDGAIVIRDIKIIEGPAGPFVAMPSRKLADHCPTCSAKNHLRARFCNECGARLNENRAGQDADGRVKLHADVAHPINSASREELQARVVAAYLQEKDRAAQPGYQPQALDSEGFDDSDFEDVAPAPRPRRADPAPRRAEPPPARDEAGQPVAARRPPPHGGRQPARPRREPHTADSPPSASPALPPPEPAPAEDPFSAGIA
jgi:stage V sporulation protein G